MQEDIYIGKKLSEILEEIKETYSKYEILGVEEKRGGFLLLRKEVKVKINGRKKEDEKKEEKKLNSDQKMILDMLENSNSNATNPANKKEMEELRHMMEQMMQQIEATKKTNKGFLDKEEDAMLLSYYRALLNADIEKKLAQRLMLNLKKELSSDESKNKEKIEEKLKKKMTSLIHTCSPIEDGVQTIALIGPTGVGKTTTLAKIAGNFSQKGERIGLITTDVYRIGATDQLKIYANILECKMITATNPDELKEAIKYFKNVQRVDKILIDTVGRSPMEKELVSNINEYIEVAQPDHTALVLSSTQKYSDINKILTNFKNVKLDSVIFTKLDETISYGTLLNVAIKDDIHLSYVTNGQNVPADISAAESQTIAKKILDGVSADVGRSSITTA